MSLLHVYWISSCSPFAQRLELIAWGLTFNGSEAWVVWNEKDNREYKHATKCHPLKDFFFSWMGKVSSISVLTPTLVPQCSLNQQGDSNLRNNTCEPCLRSDSPPLHCTSNLSSGVEHGERQLIEQQPPAVPTTHSSLVHKWTGLAKLVSHPSVYPRRHHCNLILVFTVSRLYYGISFPSLTLLWGLVFLPHRRWKSRFQLRKGTINHILTIASLTQEVIAVGLVYSAWGFIRHGSELPSQTRELSHQQLP